ncbi:MAG: DUF5685 family protein [Clostridiaceae bacterium]|nr:DUF5685 family protein [Clostridiaceae bacterium]
MFGYVTANTALLSEDELARWKGCYCGLCRSLADLGGRCRLTLSYDLAFLTLLLSSLYEPEEHAGTARCPRHPLKKQPYWRNEITDYAARMNVLLTRDKLLDDWHDDRNPASRAAAAALCRQAEEAAKAYPRQAEAVRAGLDKLSALEKAGTMDIDAAGASFGSLLGELFVWKKDRWEPELRALGDGLGRYIYTLDACLDLPADRAKGRYNPLLGLAPEDASPEQFRPALQMLLGGAAEAFERLPLVRDVHILRSVLYSGVWARLPAPEEKEAQP